MPRFVSPSYCGRVRIRYRRPKEVGADRIVNARAAFELSAAPSIVIDFGTATTFDCVSEKGEYLGGVIAPGPVISAQALHQRTAKLPRVRLEKPAHVLGLSTLECIQAGLYHGYRGLVREIVQRLKEKMGPNCRVWATGGQARWILKGLPEAGRYDANITLWGAALVWQDEERLRHQTR